MVVQFKLPPGFRVIQCMALLVVTACSHAPGVRAPASASVAVGESSLAASVENPDEFYKSLSDYPDGVAVAGYARAYHERFLNDEPWQEVAAPFVDYISIVSDFEVFVDGPESLKCVQGTTFRGVTDVFMTPVIHGLDAPSSGLMVPRPVLRSVQVFPILQKTQPRLYPQILCKYSGPGDYLDFKITLRFPQPRRRLTDQGELLRRMQTHLHSDVLALDADEKKWVTESNLFQEGQLKISSLVPQAILNFEQPDEFLMLHLSSGNQKPMEIVSKGIYKLVASSKGYHFAIAPEDLEFPSIPQNVFVCADSNDRILIRGDRENEFMTRGFQGSIRCLINTPKGSPSRWKGRFDVRTMRIPVDVLLGKIEELLRPLESKTIEADLELATDRITKLRLRFEEKAVGYPRSRYDLLYKLASKKNPPPFKALKQPQVEEINQ